MLSLHSSGILPLCMIALKIWWVDAHPNHQKTYCSEVIYNSMITHDVSEMLS